MSEMEKDLRGFDCGICPNMARLKKEGKHECWEWTDGRCSVFALQWAAARLEELGYVKVVRCGECKFKKHCEQLIGNTATGWPTSIDYCSAGERVVAKDATGEEVPDGR